MFFNSIKFKALEAGARLTWADQELRMQNISNVSTPGYKAKRLRFDDVLKGESDIRNLENNTITADVVESKSLSNRPDGNNVDIEVENLMLYDSYVKYSMVMDKVKGEFDKYNYVLNSNMK